MQALFRGCVTSCVETGHLWAGAIVTFGQAVLRRSGGPLRSSTASDIQGAGCEVRNGSKAVLRSSRCSPPVEPCKRTSKAQIVRSGTGQVRTSSWMASDHRVAPAAAFIAKFVDRFTIAGYYIAELRHVE